jgi:hypothetical protein
MSSQKSLALAGVGIAFLVGAGYAASRWLVGGELTPLAAAELISQEAVITGYLSTDPNDWSQLERVGIPQSLLENNWKKARQEMFAGTKIDYARDLQPWLGGMAFAIIPDATTQELSEPGFLAIFGIKNKLKAYAFLKKVEQEAKNIQKTDYHGITIRESQDSSEPSYVAVVGNKILVATNRQVIEQAIDTDKGLPSLADREETKAAFSEKLALKNSLGQIYLTNYPQLIKSLAQSQNNSELDALPVWDEVNYIVVGIGAENQSLRLQSITQLNSERLTQGFSQPSGKLLAQLPENTISLVNGSSINQIWSNTVTQLEADRTVNGYLNMLRGGLQMSSGLDLDRDIFGWMDGEFAVGLISTQTAIIPGLGFGLGGAMLFETKQPDLAKQTLAKLENLLQLSVGGAPNQIEIQGKTMTQWREPQSNFTLAYGWLDNNSLMFAVGEEVAESLGTKSLAKNTKFKAIAKQLPNKNFGYFYLDMDPIATGINGLSDYQKQEITPEAIELINSIDSIGATSTMSSPTTVRGDLAIRFKH